MSDRDLRLKDRAFPTAMARAMCRAVLRGNISPNTWATWRRRAGIRCKAKFCTFDEICILVAISRIRSDDRRDGGRNNRPLSDREIQNLADSKTTQDEIAALINVIDELGYAIGRDAPIALMLEGVRVSRATLYRNVPAFSATKLYKVEYLKKLAIA
jgi:hypothetical protein